MASWVENRADEILNSGAPPVFELPPWMKPPVRPTPIRYVDPTPQQVVKDPPAQTARRPAGPARRPGSRVARPGRRAKSRSSGATQSGDRPRSDDADRRRSCDYCGGLFDPENFVGRPQRYCQDAHKSAAYRARKREVLQRGLIRLVESDSRAFLRSLPDECVDLVLTDFPYFFRRSGTYFRKWFETLPDEDLKAATGELARVLRPDGHLLLFADWHYEPVFGEWCRSLGLKTHRSLVWDKESAAMGGDVWSQHEYIVHAEKGRREGNLPYLPSILRGPRRRPNHGGYPTEKHVSVLSPLIEHWTSPGDVVLDPFCGSGNVGVAARRLGRRALLNDLTAEFAGRRLRVAVASPDDAEATRNFLARRSLG